jgi:hypothetical protein
MTENDLDALTNPALIERVKDAASSTVTELHLADRLESAIVEIDLLVRALAASRGVALPPAARLIAIGGCG